MKCCQFVQQLKGLCICAVGDRIIKNGNGEEIIIIFFCGVVACWDPTKTSMPHQRRKGDRERSIASQDEKQEWTSLS